jgi:PmbA protein
MTFWLEETPEMSIEKSVTEVMAQLKQAGAEGDLIIDEGQSLSLKARDGELEEHKVSSSQIFGLRVIRDGHVGTAYSEASDSEALSSMVDQALLNASYAKLEPEEKILPTSGKLVTDDKLLCPVDETPVDEKIQFALSLEQELAARDKVKNVPYNGVQDTVVQRRFFTSAGLEAYARQKMCVASAFALMEEGEANIMSGTGRAARLFGDLNVADIVDEAHERCLGLLHGKAIPSKHYDVIFDDECQVDMFHAFTLMFSGQSAKDGVNPMRDKLGDVVADARLCVLDQPLNAEGFGYSLFDAEGTATRETALIADGRLETLIHNSATAAHFGLATTGHASRGTKSRLGVGLHQLHISPGDDAESSLFAGEYLELTDLTGLHSGANPVSGQFSFGASGYLCRDGERVQPVRNITVAGNFYDMLTRVSAIGDALFWDLHRSALMPHVRFADVAISG